MSVTKFVKTGGSNASDGLSWANAWLTFDKTRSDFSNAALGDVYSYKGGDSFVTAGFAFTNLTDFSTNKVRFASTDIEKSIIRAESSNHRIFNFNASHNGAVVQGLKMEGDFPTTGSYGIYFSENAQNGLFRINKISGFRHGVDVFQASEGVNPSNVTITKNKFLHNAKTGVFGGADNFTITYNQFDNCGYGQTVLDHAVYFTGYDTTTNTISYNTIRNTNHVVDGCDAAIIVGHGRVTDVLIENNWSWEVTGTPYQNGYGVSIGPGNNGFEEWTKGAVIKHNFFYGFGRNGIITVGTDDSVVERNIVVQTGIQNSTSFYAFNAEQNYGTDDTYQCTNATIQNNICYWDTTAGLTVSGTGGSGVNIDPTIGGTLTESNNLVVGFTPPLNCMLTSYPTKGKITSLGVDGAFDYEYEGVETEDTDSFTFMIFDTNGQSEEATVNITISGGGLAIVDVTTAAFTGVSPDGSYGEGFAWADNGSKVLVTAGTTGNMHAASTPYDVTTITTPVLSTFTPSGTAYGCDISADGMTVWVMQSDNELYQYDLSIAFDLASASAGVVSATSAGSTRNFCWDEAGAVCYTVLWSAKKISKYNCGTPYNPATMTLEATADYVMSEPTIAMQIARTGDGFIIGDFNGKELYQYDMTGTDVSTISYFGVSALGGYNACRDIKLVDQQLTATYASGQCVSYDLDLK